MKRQIFTLMELLIVIALIAILAAMLLSALGRAREKAISISCINQLRQMAFGFTGYHDSNDGWMNNRGNPIYSDYWTDLPGRPYRHWMSQIGEYVGINLTNETRMMAYHGIFQCPAQKNRKIDDIWAGDNGVYGGYGWNDLLGSNVDAPANEQRRRINAIKVPSDTLILSDTTDYSPAGTNKYAPFRIFYNWDPIYSPRRHYGGGNILCADGHVGFLFPLEFYKSKSWWPDKNIVP